MKRSKLIISTAVVGTMILSSSMPVLAYTKEETVYTKLNTQGEETLTIVSEHLKNDKKEKDLKDLSNLESIVNVNGDEKFTQDHEKINWESQGNDIYYQGKTQQQLPITMKVTYQFNGKTSTVEDMLGKKGKVKIHIQYTNHAQKTVNNEKLYVPFLVMTGTILPTDVNSHVEVTNGKVTTNGSNHMIIGMATPGLSKDYKNDKLKDFDELTIQYETTDFELKSLMSVATPTILSKDDMKVFDKMDDGYSLMDQLSSSYQQLKQGSSTLNKGMSEFSDKYQLFHTGVQTLDQQSSVLVNGVSRINQGIGQLDQGLNQLNGGLHTLSQNSESLRQGATQLSQQIVNTVNLQLKQAGLDVSVTKDDYDQKLSGLLQQMNQKKSQLQKQYEQLNALPDEQKEAYLNQIIQLKTGIAQIDAALPQITVAKTSLDNIQTFVKGIYQYTTGVDQASQSMPQIQKGSSQLLDGSSQLVKGVDSLLAGTHQLSSHSQLLNQAANELQKGSKKLNEGLNEFDEKGLSKIHQFVNGDIKTNVNKTKTLIQLANDYQTFTKLDNKVTGQTKFIMIIDSKSK